jgi:hypothetical protein
MYINFWLVGLLLFIICFITYNYRKLKHEEERAELLYKYLVEKSNISWEDYCYSLGKEDFI